ncbi:toprim domain-containing protein [Spiroplasma turonicum]|uniref:Recombination protein RecR n=1 Tax=Spiroplasma turonicum TaxID=216946 RepID=A0A0K1P4P4_9MOLU|nr:toprim domain-containing protein [Spiroplasma turonicum]AKU79253.1 recombination protein RecR [Spiroplasma turonicum]ALX70276.1 recombination protein RecR [Spiroplasma turonicum]
MKDLVERLKKIEGITEKTSEKIIFDLIENDNKLTLLKETLDYIEKNYKSCEVCNYYKFKNICDFCDNKTRDKNLICVVTSKKEAKKVFKSNYKGLIHVLNGEINLNKNILPESIHLPNLFARISKETEVIIATNLTFNGEVTANYILNSLKNECKKITRLARGIPFGGSLDYLDDETLTNAIENRKIIKK